MPAIKLLKDIQIQIIIFLSILLALSLLAAVNSHSLALYTSPYPQGFSKIKPVWPENYLSVDGNYSGWFTNEVGKTITIKRINFDNVFAVKPCAGRPSTYTLSPGNTFLVTTEGCGRGQMGDAYLLNVIIEYEIADNNITLKESGKIRGLLGMEKPTLTEEILNSHYPLPITILLVLILAAMYIFFKKHDPNPVKNEYALALLSIAFGILLSYILFLSGIDMLFHSIQLLHTWLMPFTPFIITTLISYLKTRKKRALLLGIIAEICPLIPILLSTAFMIVN